MNKWTPAIRWIFIVVVTLLVLTALKDFLIKTAIELAAPSVIGSRVEMDGFSLGLFTHRIHIKNFRLYNPPGFPSGVFLAMPEIMIDVDMPELMKAKMHFPRVVFNLSTAVIIKNKQGKLNIDSLKIIEEQKKANKGKPVKLPVFKIDRLDLNIGKVVTEDYTHAPPVRVEAYDVGVKNLKITNINGLPKLIAVVMVEAAKPTAMRGAGMYAAETLLGVGFLPALAFTVVAGKDEAAADFNFSMAQVYQESLKLAGKIGTIEKDFPQKGQIMAKVYGCNITINIEDRGWNKSHIRIKAREFMLPKYPVANGFLYQLSEKLH